MRVRGLIAALALAGCGLPAADPLPSAGALAQAGALDGAPPPPKGATMRFPYPSAGKVFDISVAQIAAEDGGLISVGMRQGDLPEEPAAREVAGKACRLIGRHPDAAVQGVAQAGRWDFAGGCR